MITAVEIDELYYAEPIKTVTTPAAGLTGAEVATILKNAATKRVKNVHGDTYQYEEAEASVTRYKNALTGEYYRETSEPGEVKINFTIGEYDYATKADLQGGKATRLLNSLMNSSATPQRRWQTSLKMPAISPFPLFSPSLTNTKSLLNTCPVLIKTFLLLI